MSYSNPEPFPSKLNPNERFPRRPHINVAKHRHASPSAPWPWVDINDTVDLGSNTREPWKCPHTPDICVGCWQKYPQSLFPNWTDKQVERSGMKSTTPYIGSCTVHRIEVKRDGEFDDPGSRHVQSNEDFWEKMQRNRRGSDVRLRALFVEDITVPVLQMIGTWYNVEPFFWTSSVNWIPSRYQENVRLKEEDHITVTLSFPRAQPWTGLVSTNLGAELADETIDTQSPLPIRFSPVEYSGSEGPYRNYVLVLDLLSVHLVRGVKTSTIISYQPPTYEWSRNIKATSASLLHSRVNLAGQSVYWKNIFKQSPDPTFVLLTMLWYALYAWDQSLELLWEHISHLEMNVIRSHDISFTQELHKIRAYLLHYVLLLEDFKKTVKFVRDTPNPAMDAPEHASYRELSQELLEKECNHLIIEIDRLLNSRWLWSKRLTNLMDLAFSNVNIADSKQMRMLTEMAVRDSAAMKQIAYLTMVFLPASFIATALGMNVQEIAPHTNGTLPQYVAAALPLTLLTMWIIIALQGRWMNQQGRHMGIISRLSWPMLYVGQFNLWIKTMLGEKIRRVVLWLKKPRA